MRIFQQLSHITAFQLYVCLNDPNPSTMAVSFSCSAAAGHKSKTGPFRITDGTRSVELLL